MNIRHPLTLIIAFLFPLSSFAATPLPTCSGSTSIPATVTAAFVDYYSYYGPYYYAKATSDGGVITIFYKYGMCGYCITKFTASAKISWRHFGCFGHTVAFSTYLSGVEEDSTSGRIIVASNGMNYPQYYFYLSAFDTQTGAQVGSTSTITRSSVSFMGGAILSNGYYYMFIVDTSTNQATMYYCAPASCPTLTQCSSFDTIKATVGYFNLFTVRPNGNMVIYTYASGSYTVKELSVSTTPDSWSIVAQSSQTGSCDYITANDNYVWTVYYSTLYVYSSPVSATRTAYSITNTVKSMGKPSADRTRVPIVFNSGTTSYYIQWASLDNTCLLTTTFTSTHTFSSSLMSTMYVISHKDLTQFWILGVTSSSTYTHGYLIKVEEVAATSGSPLYFNQALATVSDSSTCHSYCQNGCFKAASTEHCVATSTKVANTYFVLFGMVRSADSGSILRDTTLKYLSTENCDSKCAEMCTTTADSTACTAYCTMSDASVDDTFSYFGICACPSGLTVSTTYHRCGSTTCDSTCKNSECGPTSSQCFECILGATATQNGKYYTCACPSGFSVSTTYKSCASTSCDPTCKNSECGPTSSECFACITGATATSNGDYYTCACPSGLTASTIYGRCVSTSCDSTCKNSQCGTTSSECFECITGATAVKNGDYYTCTCPSGFSVSTNYKSCAKTSCDSTCKNSECGPTSSQCFECVFGATSTANGNYYTCACPSGFTVSTTYKSCASTTCDSTCKNSECGPTSSQCFECVSGVTATQNGGYYTCTCPSGTYYDTIAKACVNSYAVSIAMQTTTKLDKMCAGYNFTASVTLPEKESVTSYVWSLTYSISSDCPSAILKELGRVTKTNSKLILPHAALCPSRTLRLTATATDTSTGTTAVSSKDIVIPGASHYFCGPCQLNDRSTCGTLNGMCWNNYLDVSDTLKATPNCLQYMVPICYGIWNVFGYSNYQCLDFQSLLNYTEMQKTPSAVSAVHDWKERARIRVYFDLPMRTSALRDCYLVLSAETMKALANKAPICTWNSHTEFQILYTPTNRVFLSNITLRNDTLFYVYPYAQVPAKTTPFQLSAISISAFSIPAVGPPATSPNSPLTLRIDLGPISGFVWEHSWAISYVSGCQYTSSQLAEAEAFFMQFRIRNSSFSVITIPMQYLYEGCQLKVVSNSFNSLFGETICNEITIKISYSETTSLGYSALEPITKNLKGDQKNSLDVVPQLWNITNGSSWSASTLSSSSLSFRVFSGSSSTSIMTRGADEMKIERTLSNTYTSIKSLSLTTSDGFKLYTYYNVSVTADYKVAGVTYKTYNDAFIVYLKRTPPSCAISSPGPLVDPLDTLMFNSSEQTIDTAHGESVSYVWTCDSCVSLITSSACSCDIFDSYQTQRASRLTISPNTLISLAKYKLSLTIIISNSNNLVSCSASTEFRTVPSARSSLRAGILAIAESSTSSKSQYIGAITANMDLNSALSKAVWTLVEITLASGQQYSIWDKYFNSIIQEEFGINLNYRRRLAEAIPSELAPAITYQSQSYPYTVKVDENTLLDNAKYTYALKLNYSNGAKPAVSTVVVGKTNNLANGAQFSVSPSSGDELSTLFTFAFSASVTNDDSSVSYQILRKDCESSSEYSVVTPRMKNVNTLVSVLYQGSSSCGNNVTLKLIVRSSDGVNSNYFQYATVSALESGLRASQIETILSVLEIQNSLSVYQTLALLSQISIGVSDTNTVSRILSLLSYFDTTSINTLLSTYDSDGIIGFFETCMTIINNMLLSKATISYDALKTITLKLQGYSETLKGVQGRSQVIQLALYALSNICDRSNVLNQANPSIPQDIYSGVTTAVYNLIELKLSEIVPGTTFEVLSSNIGITIEGRSFATSLSRPYVTTVQDQTVYVPEGVALLFSNQSVICTAYNCTLSIATISMSFSPYPELKRHVTLNENSLKANSLSDGRIAPGTMKKLYADLKDSSTSVNSAVNTDLYSSKTIQVSFYALSYSLASSERVLLNTNIGLGALPTGKEIVSEIALTKAAMESVYSPRIPLYYQHSSNSWMNDLCYLDTSFTYLDQGSSLSILPDNTVASQSTATYFTLLLRCPSYATTTTAASSSRVALALTIDVFPQMNDILILTNYQSPFDSGPVKFGYKASAIYAILFGVLLLTTISTLIFFFTEKFAFARIKFDILTQYIKNSLPSSRSLKPSFLGTLAQYLVSVRMNGYATSNFCDVSVPHPMQKETGLGVPSPSVLSSPPPAQAKGDNASPETFHGISQITAKGLVEHEDAIIRNIYEDVTAQKKLEEQKEPEGGTPTKAPVDENTEFLVLRARTAAELDCGADLLNGTILGLFKTGYAFLNLFFVQSFSNPRYIRAIALGAVYLGELFITGAFVDQNDSVRIADDGVHFTRVMIGTCAVAIGCMVGLKLFFKFACVAKQPRNQMAMKDLKRLNQRNITGFCIGLTVALAWIGVCIWRVVIMGRDGTSIALEKWLWSYLLCAGIELLIVDLLKIALIKVLLNSLLKWLSGTAFIATSCGLVVRAIVDFIYSSFS